MNRINEFKYGQVIPCCNQKYHGNCKILEVKKGSNGLMIGSKLSTGLEILERDRDGLT